MSHDLAQFDRQIRHYVYDVAMQRGAPPTLSETKAALGVPLHEVRQAFQRLADSHVLVLQRDSDEILMANPFSAVPTPFLVELPAFACYANCIWDALGVPAMLKQSALIRTSCADCGTALQVEVSDGTVRSETAVVHFAIPARHWWDDIVFT